MAAFIVPGATGVHPTDCGLCQGMRDEQDSCVSYGVGSHGLITAVLGFCLEQGRDFMGSSHLRVGLFETVLSF